MRLLIIGAGGHGRCCKDIASRMGIYETIDFLDDQMQEDLPIVGTIDQLRQLQNEYDHVFTAIGNNGIRKKIDEMIKEEKKTNLIDPTAILSSSAQIGKSNVIFPYTSIESKALIGDGCILCANSVINHDATICNYVLIYTNTTIRPNTTIKDEVKIGSNCCICMGTNIEERQEIEDGKTID